MAYQWLGIISIALAMTLGCGSETTPGGGFGIGGTGGGFGGAGGTAGTPDWDPQCVTSPLCQACPSEALCDSDENCAEGFVCIRSGCDDLEGAPVQQCVFAGGGACNDSSTCGDGRECVEVAGEGKRCIKTSPGCDTSRDCLTGFECEDNACVDRRVPCVLDEDCPKNHLCFGGTNSTFCLRIQTACLEDFDCVDRAPYCIDIDGDGKKECAGSVELNPASGPCANDLCEDPGAPVCEASSVSSVSQCGRYGLCLSDEDCVSGDRCVGLWPDGRKECVPEGGDCASLSDCPENQVCASGRTGGAPACQAGAVDGGE
jgi:hypothetical protein